MTNSHNTSTPALSVESEYVLVPREFLHFLRSAPVSSGVCCCGDEMDRHSDPMSCGYSPVDMWDHGLDQWLKQIAAAPAPNPSPAAKGGEAEAATKGPYEARFCKDMPTSSCDYGVVSMSSGVEVCRVWSEQDALVIAAALATPSTQPADAVREALEAAADRAWVLAKSGATAGQIAHAVALTEPAPAGEAVEPIRSVAWRLAAEIAEAYENNATQAEATNMILAAFAQPAPEDTARLREDLERVTRELTETKRRLAEEFANMDATMKGWDALCLKCDDAERERDDARKALETAREEAAQDEADRILSTFMNVREGSWAGGAIQWLRMDGAMQPAQRAADRSASREGASDE